MKQGILQSGLSEKLSQKSIIKINNNTYYNIKFGINIYNFS